MLFYLVLLLQHNSLYSHFVWMKLAKRVTLCRKVPVWFCVSSNFLRWVRAEVSTAKGLCRVPGCPRDCEEGVGIEPAGLEPDWPPGTSTGGCWQWLLGSSGAEARGAGVGLALARASPPAPAAADLKLGWVEPEAEVGGASREMEQELEPVKGEGRAGGSCLEHQGLSSSFVLRLCSK